MSDDNVMDWHQYSLECNAPMLGKPSGEQPQPSKRYRGRQGLRAADVP